MKSTMRREIRKNGHITEWFDDFPITEYFCDKGYKFVFDAPTTPIAKAWLTDSENCLIFHFIGEEVLFTQSIKRIDYIKL